jgi:fission process protein 1
MIQTANVPRHSWCGKLVFRSNQRPVTVRASNSEKSSRKEKDSGAELNIFETIGTEKDSSGWEPFVQRSSAAALINSLDFSEPISFDGEEKTEYDPLRDGPLRYLGYSNELGEAFASWLFPGGVTLSYAVAVSYVLFDTWDKYKKTLDDAQCKISSDNLPETVDRDELIATIGVERGVDTLVWQLLASVAIPGYTIHTVVGVVRNIVQQMFSREEIKHSVEASFGSLGIATDTAFLLIEKSLPTFVGLLTIPFIVHPIDSAVHALLNASLRRYLRTYICEMKGGKIAGLPICVKCEDAE